MTARRHLRQQAASDLVPSSTAAPHLGGIACVESTVVDQSMSALSVACISRARPTAGIAWDSSSYPSLLSPALPVTATADLIDGRV